MFLLGEPAIAVHDEGDVSGHMPFLHDRNCQFLEGVELQHTYIIQ